MAGPVLAITGLHKRFAVPVLRGVDFSVDRGRVHALVGANGAGKTTLCRIVCGLTPADAGEMRIEGEPYAPQSLVDAEACGIRIVMQEPHLIDNLSIAENLFFASLPTRRGLIDFERLHDETSDALEAAGLASLDPRCKVGALGIGHRQLIEIARVLLRPCKLLILDEPTAALTDPQIDLLFARIADLKARGTGIVYVSHRISEFKRIADTITVLKNGRTVSTSAVADLDARQIVRLMAGTPGSGEERREATAGQTTALRVRGLASAGLLRDVDLDIRYGEMLGIAGLIGAGRTELLRAIFGAAPMDAGHLEIDGERQVIESPRQAIARGIGLIPEDRVRQGLLGSQSIARNVTLGSEHRFGRSFGRIDRAAETEAVEDYRRQLAIECTGISQPVAELSGGNQQKVVISRWLMKDCRILLFDEPTRGIDIQTREAIYRLLHELAGKGKAVVVVSSEVRELTTICDRIVVLSNGRLAADFGRGEWSAEKIMAAAFSAYTGDAAA